MVLIAKKVFSRKFTSLNSICYFTSNIKFLKTAVPSIEIFYIEEMIEKLMPYEITL